jgi:hypothetical protein
MCVRMCGIDIMRVYVCADVWHRHHAQTLTAPHRLLFVLACAYMFVRVIPRHVILRAAQWLLLCGARAVQATDSFFWCAASFVCPVLYALYARCCMLCMPGVVCFVCPVLYALYVRMLVCMQAMSNTHTHTDIMIMIMIIINIINNINNNNN